MRWKYAIVAMTALGCDADGKEEIDMPQKNWVPDAAGTYWGAVTRQDENGVIFLTAGENFDFFAALLDEGEIRKAIEDGMKLALRDELKDPQVFTNGKLTGPKIDFGVRLRSLPALKLFFNRVFHRDQLVRRFARQVEFILCHWFPPLVGKEGEKE